MRSSWAAQDFIQLSLGILLQSQLIAGQFLAENAEAALKNIRRKKGIEAILIMCHPLF